LILFLKFQDKRHSVLSVFYGIATRMKNIDESQSGIQKQ